MVSREADMVGSQAVGIGTQTSVVGGGNLAGSALVVQTEIVSRGGERNNVVQADVRGNADKVVGSCQAT